MWKYTFKSHICFALLSLQNFLCSSVHRGTVYLFHLRQHRQRVQSFGPNPNFLNRKPDQPSVLQGLYPGLLATGRE